LSRTLLQLVGQFIGGTFKGAHVAR